MAKIGKKIWSELIFWSKDLFSFNLGAKQKMNTKFYKFYFWSHLIFVEKKSLLIFQTT